MSTIDKALAALEAGDVVIPEHRNAELEKAAAERRRKRAERARTQAKAAVTLGK